MLQMVLDPTPSMTTCIGSVMGALVLGRPFTFDDPRVTLLNDLIDQQIKVRNQQLGNYTNRHHFQHQFSLSGALLSAYPSLRHVPLFGHFGFDRLKELNDRIAKYFESEIEQHEQVSHVCSMQSELQT